MSSAGYEIEARGDCIVFAVDAPELRCLAYQHPALIVALLRLQAELAQRLAVMLEEVAGMPLRARLIRRLQALANAFEVPRTEFNGGRRIGIRVTQRDLADLSRASRQRVNVEIKQMEKRGHLRLVGGYLELLPHSLTPQSDRSQTAEEEVLTPKWRDWSSSLC